MEQMESALKLYDAMSTNSSISIVSINVTTDAPFDVFRAGMSLYYSSMRAY